MNTESDTEISDPPSMIDAQDVRLTYNDGTEALRGADLTIPKGEFFGLLGPNGAGKTSFVKTLVTLLSPTDGAVFINGHDVTESKTAVRHSIGYMAQETSVDPELTARENISFACDAYGVPAAERDDRIDELLELIGLADVADKTADEYSGGMKKRLDAAMALVHRPPIVFLDEPTTGLDPEIRLRLWDHFREINEQGTTVFLTTQYLEEADELCDRIGLLQDGEIIATDDPERLKSRVGGDVLELSLEASDAPELKRAVQAADASGLFQSSAIESTADGLRITASDVRAKGTDLLVELSDAGFTVTGFDIRSPTLDDVFLSLTGETIDDETVDGPESSAERAETEVPQ